MGRWVALAGKIAVTALLLYFALRGTDFDAAWARWSMLDPLWLLPTLALMLVQLLLAAWRWHLIAAPLGEHTHGPRRAWIMLVSTFFNQTLPSVVGGDAIRIWLTRGQGLRAAVFAVLIDRGAGLLGLLVLVAVCLPGSWALVNDAAGRTALTVIVAGGIGGAVFFFLIGRLRLPAKRLLRPLAMLAQIARAAATVLLRPRPGLAVALLSVLIHLLTVATVLCLAWGLAVPLATLPALYLIPPVVLITVLPVTVAGWGLRENAMIVALAYVGIVEADAVALSILYGGANLALGAAGGLAWLAGGAERPNLAAGLAAAEGESGTEPRAAGPGHGAL
jgi:glycosyltransferase 2 family protein